MRYPNAIGAFDSRSQRLDPRRRESVTVRRYRAPDRRYDPLQQALWSARTTRTCETAKPDGLHQASARSAHRVATVLAEPCANAHRNRDGTDGWRIDPFDGRGRAYGAAWCLRRAFVSVHRTWHLRSRLPSARAPRGRHEDRRHRRVKKMHGVGAPVAPGGHLGPPCSATRPGSRPLPCRPGPT